MNSILLDGHGGREASIASRLSGDDPNLVINAVVGHENPTIIDAVARSGGSFEVGDPTDPNVVGSFAARTMTELAVISNDNALAAGVVDALQAQGIPTVGPSRDAARVEWDKAFARQLIGDIYPSLNPFYTVVDSEKEARNLLDRFERERRPVVVKPLGLTGGKGVKVMGPHFSTYDEAYEVTMGLLRQGDQAVMLEEKVDSTAVEYTAQVFTDGNVAIGPPITVDYPYRYDGDKGPGTGGMGVFTERGNPSYLTPEELETTRIVSHDLVQGLARAGLDFTGVLNIGFFATPDGLKVVETNARPGDPECINMMLLMHGNLPTALGNIAARKLTPTDISFKDAASVVVCLVDKQYAQETVSAQVASFSVNHEAVQEAGAQLFFASAVPAQRDGEFVTVGSSRALAVGALGETLEEARAKAYTAISNGITGPLEYRQDIGDPNYIQAMAARRHFRR